MEILQVNRIVEYLVDRCSIETGGANLIFKDEYNTL